MAAAAPRRHSCETAAKTLEWMNSIAVFLLRYRFLFDAHVVNFFKDSLWESIDSQWMECLRKESVENLLGIPSGLVQEHWPPSLREFVVTLRSLALPREQNLSNAMLEKFHIATVSKVLSQGMNSKKKHEVEILAAAVSTIAHGLNAQKIIDVGSGQGYLAQVLSFEHQLSVIAIDSSLHHSTITRTRSNRLKKHYAAKLRKLHLGDEHLKVPQTITLQVFSSDSLAALSISAIDDHKHSDISESGLETNFLRSSELGVCKAVTSCNDGSMGSSSVLVGLHACGDLSVNMLRAFVDCEQVKALISVGCCYNLLTDESFKKTNPLSGFPLSNAAKLCGLNLGKGACDLACQSAERWKSLTKDAALQNFELHAFRSTFQMILDKYYPEIIASSPSIGRQGKALRRQMMRKVIESQFGSESPVSSCKHKDENKLGHNALQPDEIELTDALYNGKLLFVPKSTSTDSERFFKRSCFEENKSSSSTSSEKYLLFKDFTKSGLHRLGYKNLQDINLVELWSKVRPSFEFIGPYWSLRAAIGPVLETYILLDRLLFLQEHGDSVEAWLVPLFDPTLSPRNIAVMARKI